MEVRKDISLMGHFWKLSILSTCSLRSSLLLQIIFLFLSHLTFLSFWWFYFHRFGSLGGWQISEMALLYSLVSGGYGLSSLFFGGSRYLARMIFEGDLDLLIAKPKPLLLQVLAIKSVPAGIGDLLSAFCMLLISGKTGLLDLAFWFPLAGCCAVMITAFAILMGSFAFWYGDVHQLSKQLFELILTFSNYPKMIFGGAARLFLLVVIPSGFIGFLPADALIQHSWTLAGAIALFTMGYFSLACLFFRYGLQRYTSGSRMEFGIR